MKTINEIIGKAVEESRSSRGLKQTDIGRVLGLSPGAVSKREAGITGFKAEELVKIAELLGHSPLALMPGGAGVPQGLTDAESDILEYYRGLTAEQKLEIFRVLARLNKNL